MRCCSGTATRFVIYTVVVYFILLSAELVISLL
jgi:hypothetical protein